MSPQFHPHGLSVEAWAEPGGRVETAFHFGGAFPHPKPNRVNNKYPQKNITRVCSQFTSIIIPIPFIKETCLRNTCQLKGLYQLPAAAPLWFWSEGAHSTMLKWDFQGSGHLQPLPPKGREAWTFRDGTIDLKMWEHALVLIFHRRWFEGWFPSCYHFLAPTPVITKMIFNFKPTIPTTGIFFKDIAPGFWLQL